MESENNSNTEYKDNLKLDKQKNKDKKSKRSKNSETDSKSKDSENNNDSKNSESDSDSKDSESDSDSKDSESDSDSKDSENNINSKDSESNSKSKDSESDSDSETDEELNLLCKAFNTSTKVFTKFPPFGNIFPSLPIPAVMVAKAAAVGAKVADVTEQIVNNNVDKLNTLATAKIDAEVAQEEKKAIDAQRNLPPPVEGSSQGGGKIIFTKEECSFF